MVLYTLAVVIKSCLMLGVHRLFYLTHVSTQLYGRACAISNKAVALGTFVDKR